MNRFDEEKFWQSLGWAVVIILLALLMIVYFYFGDVLCV